MYNITFQNPTRLANILLQLSGDHTHPLSETQTSFLEHDWTFSSSASSSFSSSFSSFLFDLLSSTDVCPFFVPS